MSLPIHAFRFNKPYNMISQQYFEVSPHHDCGPRKAAHRRSWWDRQALMAKGIAVVSMDLRGAGASFGSHRGPWMDEEVDDSIEVIDWVRPGARSVEGGQGVEGS
jgi:predicted acyl esterase